MKKTFTFLVLLTLVAVSSVFAQTPQQFKYQAVLRDASNVIVASTAKSVVIDILQGSSSGTSVYQETHSITTTAQGVINLNIGAGTVNSGVFANIPWSTNSYWVKVTVDGVDISNGPLLSVPFALNAKYAESANYNNLTNKPTIPAAQVQTDWNAATGTGVLLNKPTLATVATSGSYADLSNKPTIPAAQVQTDWNAASGTGVLLNKPTLATVATSGSYADLTNKPTNNWLTSGNAGTTAGDNFIGTSDNQDVVIKRYNTQSGLLNNASGNTSWGVSALNPSSTGGGNTAIGQYALLNSTSGNANTAIGRSALQTNTSGGFNTSMGTQSLQNNTTASQNIAIGSSALMGQSYDNSGTEWISSNVAIGYFNLSKNQPTSTTNGIQNTSIGNWALTENTTGYKNNATGYQALNSNTTGYQNTADGYHALINNTTGYNNTALGYNANVSGSGLSNATAIGANAYVGASNSLVLGSITGVNSATASTNVGIGTSTPAAKLDVQGASGTTLKIVDGNQAAGKVLTSDANGIASWQTATNGTVTNVSGTSPINVATGTSTPVISLGTVPVANGGTGTTTGSITGTDALTFAAGGSNKNITLTPSGTGNTLLNGNVGVGTPTPNSSAVLDVSSTTKGFLPPRMTYAQKIAITSPPAGLMVWCNNCGTHGELQVFNGDAWTNLIGGTASASLPGAPTIGTAIAGAEQASVSFIAPASDGGSAIISYTATSNPGNITGTLTQAGSGTIIVTGLTNGTAYTFTVTATNATGTSVASAASNSVTPSFAIGKSYGGGIIAYILQSGDPGYVSGETHGLIAATADQSTGIVWAIPAYLYTSVSGTLTAIGSGSANTDKIIAQNGAGTTYAAGLARAYTGGGYNDWYLPSKDELATLYAMKVLGFGGFSNVEYWSSSESNSIQAYYQNLSGGFQTYSAKYVIVYNVRAVRSF